MPAMPKVGRRIRKRVKMHVKKGHVSLRKAVKKLVIARVLSKHGKTKRAIMARKAGRRALTRALGHYTKATNAKVQARVAARRRMGGGGGGGGFNLGNILGSAGGIVSGLLGAI